MTRTARNILLLTIFCLWSHSAACREAPLSAKQTIELSAAVYAGDVSALMYIAKENRLFEKHGLKVDFRSFKAGRFASDALLKGEVDVATVGEFVMVSNSFKRPDIRLLACISKFQLNDLIARKDRGIQAPKDLKGKKIGILKNSQPEFHLGVFLAYHHVDERLVKKVYLKPAEIIDGMVKGSIDATMFWYPYVSTIKSRLGDNAVIWKGQIWKDDHFLLLTTADWIAKNSAGAEKLLRALMEAEVILNRNPAKTREYIITSFQYDPGSYGTIWRKMHLNLSLSQAFLLDLEDQAEWALSRGIVTGNTIPNYLNLIYMDALDAVDSKRITIIR